MSVHLCSLISVFAVHRKTHFVLDKIVYYQTAKRILRPVFLIVQADQGLDGLTHHKILVVCWESFCLWSKYQYFDWQSRMSLSGVQLQQRYLPSVNSAIWWEPLRKHAYSNILKNSPQKLKVLYLSHFCSKTKLWILVRTALPRRF